jgi:hypothetical protein
LEELERLFHDIAIAHTSGVPIKIQRVAQFAAGRAGAAERTGRSTVVTRLGHTEIIGALGFDSTIDSPMRNKKRASMCALSTHFQSSYTVYVIFFEEMMRFIALFSLLLVLAGCATGPQYSDIQANIRPVAADKGRIYFYRTTWPPAVGMQPVIYANGKAVGNSQPDGFFFIDIEPGNITVEIEKTVWEENITTLAHETVTGVSPKQRVYDNALNFVLKPGQTLYVETSPNLRDKRVDAKLVEEERARKRLVPRKYTPSTTSLR